MYILLEMTDNKNTPAISGLVQQKLVVFLKVDLILKVILKITGGMIEYIPCFTQ